MDIFLTITLIFVGILVLQIFSYYIGFIFYLVGKLFAFFSFPLNLIDLYIYPVGNMVYIVYYFGLFVLLFMFGYHLIIKLKRL